MAHELGHNLGSGHLKGSCTGSGYFMSSSGLGYETFGWSPCSKSIFQAKYITRKNEGQWCMGIGTKFFEF